MSSDYDRAAELMRTVTGLRQRGKGATETEIGVAAERLEVPLTGSYHNFLKEFGWADFGHWFIYGLGADVPVWVNIERHTIRERTEMYPKMPTWLVPFYNDGMGNHLCVDTKRLGEQDEHPIVFWDHDLGEDQQIEVKFLSFGQWLHRKLSETG